jgi:hypothetical protein
MHIGSSADFVPVGDLVERSGVPKFHGSEKKKKKE